MSNLLLVGAVAYDPKVVVIWDIIKDFFGARGCPIDYVFYSNYELLQDALVAGHVQIAWNSPLAWLDALRKTGGACRAIAMRDTDRDRVSYLLTRKDAGIKTIEDLRGKTVAVGAKDSPQATLIPLGMLDAEGLTRGVDFQVKRFDLLVGKHGDHVGGELEALKCLLSGGADACALLDFNWMRWSADGTADPNLVAPFASTGRFDHCNFTVLESFARDNEERWLNALFSMTYDDPAHREMMDLEGLKEWQPGRTEGYALLDDAVRRLRYFDDVVA